MRLTDPCLMILVMTKHFDQDNQLLSISFDAKKKPDFLNQHNHILQEVDDIKINFALKATIDEEVAKEYHPVVINRNMQDIKFERNFEALKIVDEASFTLLTMHNVSRSFKKINPDQRLIEAN